MCSSHSFHVLDTAVYKAVSSETCDIIFQRHLAYITKNCALKKEVLEFYSILLLVHGKPEESAFLRILRIVSFIRNLHTFHVV